MAIKSKFATREFTHEQLEDWGLPYESDLVVKDQILDHFRWSIVRELLFRAPDDHQIYRVLYEVPATERQEVNRWGGDPTVTGLLMQEYTRTIVAYREVFVSEDTDGNSH